MNMQKLENVVVEMLEGKMRMYVWVGHGDFLAVAHAETVEEARALVLDEIGPITNLSSLERASAAEWVRENTPTIWRKQNAEFTLTDMAVRKRPASK